MLTGSTRTIRVFVSSTFSDLQAERRALHERVFPRLRRLCGSLGASFQAVDLRWGVSRSAAEAGETMRICLGEIDRCRMVTTRPNFILLLGDRYGWRPLPEAIPEAEFERVQDYVAGGVDAEALRLLRHAYRRDANVVPAVYTRVSGAGSDDALARVLRAAAAGLDFTPAERRRYEASATEQEVAHRGLLDSSSTEGVFAFFREIEDLPRTRARGFTDLDPSGAFDPEARAHLGRLKQALRDQLGPGVVEYRSRWTAGGPTHDHIDRLCADVHDRLASTIRDELAGAPDTAPIDAELAAHREFAADRSRVFVGRADALRTIGNYLRAPARHPLIVHGESGSGKSTLLARALRDLQPQASSEPIVRFIGAVPGSSGIRSLLEGMVTELRRHAEEDTSDVPADYDALAAEFRQRVAAATAARPIRILIDAIDQLTAQHGARALGWLPALLPEHTHIVITTTPGDALDAAERLVPESHHYELEPMAAAEGDTLLGQWLAEAGRALQPVQRSHILNGFAANGLPLWLRLAFEESRRWTSITRPPGLPLDIPGIIRALYERLGAETQHGGVLVMRALANIAAARNGLAAHELLDVLSADDQVMADFRVRSPDSPPVDALPDIIWSRLHFDLAPYLAERATDGVATLDFFHRQLREVVESDWLSGVDRRRRHRTLAAWFGAQPDRLRDGERDAPNLRRLSELPYQLTHGELWADLDRTLTRFAFLSAKTGAHGLASLLEDFDLPRTAGRETRMAAAVGGIRHLQAIRESLRLGADEITADAAQLAPQLIGRLRGHRLRRVHRLLADADAGAVSPWLRPLVPSLAGPGGPLMAAVVLDQTIASLAMIGDGERLVVGCEDGSVRVIETETGREWVRVADHADHVVGVAAFEARGSTWIVSCGRDGDVSVRDLESGARHASFTVAARRLRALAAAPAAGLAFIAGYRATDRSGVFEGMVSIRELDGRERLLLASANNGVHTLAVSPDGTRVLTGAADDVLELWDAESGKRLQASDLGDEVLALAWAPAAGTALVASGTQRTGRYQLRLWDVDAWSELHIFRHDRSVSAAAITPEGLTGITGAYDTQVRVWDLHGRRQRIALRAHDTAVKAVAIRDDGRRAVSAAGATVCLWSLDEGATPPRSLGHDEAVRAAAASADGRLAVTAAQNGQVALWDLKRLRCARRRTIADAGITALALPENGRFVLAGTTDGTVVRWDVRSDRVRCVARLHDRQVTALALARDGRSAAAGCHRIGTLFEFDAGGNAEIRGSDAEVEWITAIAFVGDTRLLYAGNFSLHLRDRKTGARLGELPTGSDAPAIAVSSDGRIAVSGTHYGRLHCWDLDRMQMLHDIAHTPWGQNCSVHAVAIAADGAYAVSGATDRDIRAWDLRTGECVATFVAEDQSVCACAAGPGRWIVGSRNGAVHILELAQRSSPDAGSSRTTELRPSP